MKASYKTLAKRCKGQAEALHELRAKEGFVGKKVLEHTTNRYIKQIVALEKDLHEARHFAEWKFFRRLKYLFFKR